MTESKQPPKYVQDLVNTTTAKFDECITQQINVINTLTLQFEKVLQESRTNIQTSNAATYGRLSSQIERHVDELGISVKQNNEIVNKNYKRCITLLIICTLLQVVTIFQNTITHEIKKTKQYRKRYEYKRTNSQTHNRKYR
jgi:hypothetical protein